ncbi:MAG TPA: hypothetical protein VGG44_11635 [Tepidisphaeraceae bacterium]|jgi:hypothetical protein
MRGLLAKTIALGSAGILFLVIAMSAAADDVTTQPTTLPASTGAFEITLTQRSPLSDYAKLQQRFNTDQSELGTDYNLADQPLLVYVPADSAQKPYGLVVVSNQDGLPSLESVTYLKDILDQHHLIMVGTKKDHLPLATNAGVCLDIVYNFKQRYTIDPTRVFLVGLSRYIEPIGICSGDVFSGGAYVWWPDYFRQIGTGPMNVKYKPTPALLRLAGAHMQVIAPFPDANDKWFIKATTIAMNADGFEHVIVAPVGHDDVLSIHWFDQVFTMMESIKPAAAAPKPVDEPQQLLNLANAYISSGMTNQARAKLNLLIEKYPGSPAAAKARDLLSQLDSQ